MAWEYKREERTFATVPEGRHRIRVKSAEMAVSKNGNEMISLQFEVSGYNSIIYHYITNNEYANQNLTQFFDAFKDIPEGDINLSHWVGKVGAAQIKHEEYNGNTNAKIRYFISANKQGDLPPWKEPEGSKPKVAEYPETAKDADGFMAIPQEALDAIPLF